MQSTFCKDLPRKKKHKEIRIAISNVIDEMEPGTTFTGLQLYELVKVRIPGINLFLETLLRYMRKYRRETVICVDRYNSIYQKMEKNNDE